MPTSLLNQTPPAQGSRKKRLTPEQIQRINDFLLALDDYGEIRLIIQRGELRYINKMESYRVFGDESSSS